MQRLFAVFLSSLVVTLAIVLVTLLRTRAEVRATSEQAPTGQEVAHRGGDGYGR